MKSVIKVLTLSTIISLLTLSLVGCYYGPVECEEDGGTWDRESSSCVTGGTTPEG